MMYMTHDINFQYFFYQGAAYCTGTKVKFERKFIETFTYNGEYIWETAIFSHRVLIDGKSEYVFMPYGIPVCGKFSGYFYITEMELKNAIEEIIKPINIELIEKKKKKDCESADVVIGWMLLFVILFFSLIFKEWYLLWMWSIIIFCIWRNRKLWE